MCEEKECLNFPCYPNCLMYVICKTKMSIVCNILERYWIRHYTIKGRSDREAWKVVNGYLPNLRSIKNRIGNHTLVYFNRDHKQDNIEDNK